MVMLQDVAVGFVAVVGALVLVRRVSRAMRPAENGAACPSCASGAGACAKPATPVAPPADHAH